MEDRTDLDEATTAADRKDAARAHTPDRPATDGEQAAADEAGALTDSDERSTVAAHEKEMMERGAHVKGEGQIE
jgi:hypothetical protein